MTRRCFFIQQLEPSAEDVVLTGPSAHHIEHVLRCRAGDPLEVKDGSGVGWHGVITAVTAEGVRVRLMERDSPLVESPLRLTLGLGFARADRMDLVLRQATELGVHRFVAFRAQRSQYGLSGPQVRKRIERWEKIAREALCQCGRLQLPEVVVLRDLSEFLSWSATAEGLRLVALEEAGQKSLLSLWREFPNSKEIVAVVGPEGGWTGGEVEQFAGGGFHAVRLGPRILRLETAATAFVSSAQLLWGDFAH